MSLLTSFYMIQVSHLFEQQLIFSKISYLKKRIQKIKKIKH